MPFAADSGALARRCLSDTPTRHFRLVSDSASDLTNWWKSFTHARLAVAMGDCGCLSIFGDRAEQHRIFAEQVTAEYFIKTEGRGRTVDEWKARPEQPDNHWLDCLVGCAVDAAMQGALLFGTDLPSVQRRDRVSFKEMQRRKRT